MTRLEAAASVQAASQDELSTQRFAVQEAQATLDQSRANLAKIKAGSWVYELKEARAQLDVAKEQANQLRVQLEQAVIRAPLTGRVLQMNIRTGQTLSVSDRVAPVLLGRTEPLQVRVDIDEVSASRLTPATPAMASLKGNAQQKFPLRFVRVEPYMIPKQNLTGDSLERVDVRVLQLIYDIAETPDFPIYVGQQVEVFVRHAPRPAARAQAHSEI